MERLAEKQIVEILERTFARSEATTVLTDFGFDAASGLRRWVDILVDHKDLGYFAIEVKGTTNARSVADWLRKVRNEQTWIRSYAQVPQVLPSQRELLALLRERDGRSRQVRFFLALPNLSVESLQSLRNPSLDQLVDHTIFREDLEEARLRQKLTGAPSVPTSGDVASKSESRFNLPRSQTGGYKVFVSYRRDDSKWAAGRIADRLKREFEDDVVFIDTQDIHLGGRWRQRIQDVLAGTSIVLAIVGAKWLTISDADSGKRRLDDPNDILRNELVHALENDLMVVPVLVDCTPVPRPDFLPTPLQALFENQVIDVSANRFERDMGPLITELRTLLGL